MGKPKKLPRRRKWKKRLLVIIPLLIAGTLLCTVGWPWVNEQKLSYDRWRMSNQIETSAELLPEITDHEALLVEEVDGKNGWKHIDAGCRDLNQIVEAHAKDEDDYLSTSTGGSFFDAWERHEDTDEAYGFVPYEKLPDLLAITDSVAQYARQALEADCIVFTRSEWDYEAMGYMGDFFALLASRVTALRLVGNERRCIDEMLVSIRLLAKINYRHSKGFAYEVVRIRNEVIENCVLPTLKNLRVPREQLDVLAASRCSMPGNDPVLWLNNAAHTYYVVCKVRDNDQMWRDLFGMDNPPSFPRFRFYSFYSGYRQLLQVCTQNALDARDGKLDLRNEDWVEAYDARFEWGFNPINQVVG